MSELGTCPQCGYKAKWVPAYLVEGDLVQCSECDCRIDVAIEDGKKVFVVSTDTTYGVD